MNDKDFETETIDCTPSWETAIKMWFTVICNTVNLDSTCKNAQAEMLRLAKGFEQANERIEDLEDKLTEAREALGSTMQTLTDLSVFETSGRNEAVYSNDVTRVCKGIADQIIEWSNEEK